MHGFDTALVSIMIVFVHVLICLLQACQLSQIFREFQFLYLPQGILSGKCFDLTKILYIFATYFQILGMNFTDFGCGRLTAPLLFNMFTVDWTQCW